mgnify:CR=1 FL=1
MRYSLLSRFQGGLVGSQIGEILANYYQGRGESLSPWSQMGIFTTEQLIRSGKLTDKDWERIEKRREGFQDLKDSASSSQTALASLPLAVFFHESHHLLTEKLRQAADLWQHPADPWEDVLLWGYAIALALKEKLEPQRFIAQLLADLATPRTPLVQQLEQVQGFLARGTGLEQVVAQLSRQYPPSRTAIALAFYCFGHAPEDFRLCVTRAARCGCQPEITAALTGALAGVHNSLSGIPARWRLASFRHPRANNCYQKAKSLFAVWSGVYDLNQAELPLSAAIASAGAIQPRPSLQIISQKE